MKKSLRQIRLVVAAVIFAATLVFTGNYVVNANSSVNPSIYSDDYGYSTLNSKEQQVYKQLLPGVIAFHNSIENASKMTYNDGSSAYVLPLLDISSYELKFNNLYNVVFALKADNPEYFWIENFSFTTNGTNNNVITARITVISDYATGSDRQAAKQVIANGITEYITMINQLTARQASQIEMELAIHDRIIKNIDYAYIPGSTIIASDEEWAHNILGVFSKQGAVCEGYAKAFQMLANYAGLTSIYVVGDAGGGHAWNYVLLDGKWYALDLTWDDQPKLSGGKNYDFFNFHNSFFSSYSNKVTDHIVDAPGRYGMYVVPELTTDMSKWYYSYFSLYITSENVVSESTFADSLAKAMQGAAKHGDGYVRLKASTSAVFNKLKELYPYVKTTAVERASTSDMQYTISGGEAFVSGSNQFVFKMTTESTSADTGTYTVSGISNKTYTGKAITQNIVVKAGTYTLKNNIDYKVIYSGNVKVGEAKVTITGLGKYASLSAIKTFTIAKANISKATFSAIGNKAYTGKNIVPAVTGKYNTRVLKKGTDYTVTYSKNKTIGTATVVVKGKGNFNGSKTIKFKIVPTNVTSIKITSKSKSKLTISYKSNSTASGYIIQYSYKKNSGYKTLKNTKANKFTQGGLKSKKVVYIRTAAYKKVKGVTYQGAYSKIIKVLVK